MCKFKAATRGRPSLSAICLTCKETYAQHRVDKAGVSPTVKTVEPAPAPIEEEIIEPLRDTLRPLTPDEEECVNWYMDKQHPGWRIRRGA